MDSRLNEIDDTIRGRAMNDTQLSANIISAVKEIKVAIIKAQSRVATNANAEMLSLYFSIGRYVSHKTKTEKWGTGVIDAVSRQLQAEMPGLRGFSGKNIRSMRHFYENWEKELIWPPLAAKLEYVEYATRDYNKPLGVATYKTADEMPEKLRRALPPIDELRRQLEETFRRIQDGIE